MSRRFHSECISIWLFLVVRRSVLGFHFLKLLRILRLLLSFTPHRWQYTINSVVFEKHCIAAKIIIKSWNMTISWSHASDFHIFGAVSFQRVLTTSFPIEFVIMVMIPIFFPFSRYFSSLRWHSTKLHDIRVSNIPFEIRMTHSDRYLTTGNWFFCFFLRFSN